MKRSSAKWKNNKYQAGAGAISISSPESRPTALAGEKGATMKIIGLEEAIREYQRSKAGRYYHGSLMFNTETREIWNDFSYEADMSWNDDYGSPAIMNLGEMILNDTFDGLWNSSDITVENVYRYLQWKFRISQTP